MIAYVARVVDLLFDTGKIVSQIVPFVESLCLRHRRKAYRRQIPLLVLPPPPFCTFPTCQRQRGGQQRPAGKQAALHLHSFARARHRQGRKIPQQHQKRTLSNPANSDVIRPSTSSLLKPPPEAYPLMPPIFHAAAGVWTLSAAGLETETKDRVADRATVALRRAATVAADLTTAERNILLLLLWARHTRQKEKTTRWLFVESAGGGGRKLCGWWTEVAKEVGVEFEARRQSVSQSANLDGASAGGLGDDKFLACSWPMGATRHGWHGPISLGAWTTPCWEITLRHHAPQLTARFKCLPGRRCLCTGCNEYITNEMAN